MTITHLPAYACALVRDLSSAFAQEALSSLDNSLSPIDMNLARKQHDAYTATIQRIVSSVEVVESSDAQPDCSFIEDTAVIVASVVVLTRPGHPSRRGEIAGVKQAIHRFFPTGQLTVHEMVEPATLDGGDCLFTGEHLFVGLSKRTNQHGADFLKSVFESAGLAKVHAINMQASAAASTLHLKCVVSGLDEGRLVISNDEAGLFVQQQIQELVGSARYQFVKVPDQVSANILTFADGNGGLKGIVIQKGFPKSTKILRDAVKDQEDCEVVELDMSEFIKADGALTCCSLLVRQS